MDTNFHSSSDAFIESKSNFASILLVQFIIPIHYISGGVYVNELLRFEIGKQTGNTFDNVYLLLCHKYNHKL